MIWFILGPILGCLLFDFSQFWAKGWAEDNFWWNILQPVGYFLSLVGVILCMVSMLYGAFLPKGYKSVTVYTVADSGAIEEVVERSGESFYIDDAGEYYRCNYSVGKALLVPFYKPEYVEMDPPAFVKLPTCPDCGAECDTDYCGECGTSMIREG